MLKQGIKIVMTSRDYIYNRARNDLKESAFPLFNESQVVIDLHKLTIDEKQKILYNHLKLCNQSQLFLTNIKPHLINVSKNNRFIPETARRLGDPLFTKNLTLSEYSIQNFVEKQESFLEDVIRSLDNDCKAALGLVYMSNGHLTSPLDLEKNEMNVLARMGSSLGNCVQAFDSMNGSLVQHTYIEDNMVWRYKHPTIGDAYAKIITQSPELLEIFLRGTNIEKLLEQITCGDVGLEKTIVVPKKMFNIVLERMFLFKESESYKIWYLSEWDALRKLLSFLSRRSSKEFLQLFVAKKPEIFDIIIKPTMYFYYSKEIDTVVKLNKFGLLPEKYRKEFVEYISQHAISGDDLYVLRDNDMQTVFSSEELEELKEKVRNYLLPRISDVRQKYENNFKDYDNYTPEEHMEEFYEKINILVKEYDEEDSICNRLEKERQKAKDWADETYYEKNEKPQRKLDLQDDKTQLQSSRSIFDDIDQ